MQLEQDLKVKESSVASKRAAIHSKSTELEELRSKIMERQKYLELLQQQKKEKDSEVKQRLGEIDRVRLQQKQTRQQIVHDRDVLPKKLIAQQEEIERKKNSLNAKSREKAELSSDVEKLQVELEQKKVAHATVQQELFAHREKLQLVQKQFAEKSNIEVQQRQLKEKILLEEQEKELLVKSKQEIEEKVRKQLYSNHQALRGPESTARY